MKNNPTSPKARTLIRWTDPQGRPQQSVTELVESEQQLSAIIANTSVPRTAIQSFERIDPVNDLLPSMVYVSLNWTSMIPSFSYEHFLPTVKVLPAAKKAEAAKKTPTIAEYV